MENKTTTTIKAQTKSYSKCGQCSGPGLFSACFQLTQIPTEVMFSADSGSSSRGERLSAKMRSLPGSNEPYEASSPKELGEEFLCLWVFS